MKNIGIFLVLFKIFGKVWPIFLKLLKSAKAIKLGLAGASLMAYSYMFTFEFAIILLIAIIFHEYGHLTAMKKCGFETKGIYLIPFMGGMAVGDLKITERKTEAYVSLMGHVYGLLLIIPFYFYYLYTNSLMVLGIISFMAMINLFNLLPINPLDGGRITKSIAFSFHSFAGMAIMILGLIASILLVYMYKMYILVFIFIIGAIELIAEYYRYQKDGNVDEIQEMNRKEITQYTAYYLLLSIVFIGIIYYCSHTPGADLALKILQDKGLE